MTHEWPMVPLHEILTQNTSSIAVESDRTYKLLGVRLAGQGPFLREEKSGNRIQASRLNPVQPNDFIYSRLFAWRGAFGLVPDEFHDCFVSSEFPTFRIQVECVLPKYLNLYFSRSSIWDEVEKYCTGTTKASRNRFKEQFFLAMHMPLPSLDEQRRLVARIEALAAKIEEARGLRRLVDIDLNRMLLSAYHNIADSAIRKPMIEVAPLTRRLANVSAEENYRQVSVRSFGRGTFHQPDLDGSDITWQKPYLVKAGDILISNIKAWEGAIAVANESDDGRYGSHRYLTCVPIQDVATSRFVCFHLLTREGLYEIGEASPGSADRNRTLSAKALMQIPIPVPPIEKQFWFDNLYAKVDALKQLQAQTQAELDGLLPSVLDRAFKGEL